MPFAVGLDDDEPGRAESDGGGGACNDDIRGEAVRLLTGLILYDEAAEPAGAAGPTTTLPFFIAASDDDGWTDPAGVEEDEDGGGCCPSGVEVRPGPVRRGEEVYPPGPDGPDSSCLLPVGRGGDSGRDFGLEIQREKIMRNRTTILVQKTYLVTGER